ncbi:hypothetical protein DdX_21115 [Ditylenchus destructor]|uniref:DUF4188 domain-containing protein n=1 Tax=Ditylenchus destructor TaxID=166010 RepID=A0AAD4MK60_9BILA|nr:hypothetical protein DdX_21115 [Ditylenchus destructor]
MGHLGLQQCKSAISTDSGGGGINPDPGALGAAYRRFVAWRSPLGPRGDIVRRTGHTTRTPPEEALPMIHPERLTARLDGDFVVFLIGMCINQPLKLHKWLPVAAAMPRMLKELKQQPERGLLHADLWFSRTILVLQYWRSMEQLLAYAKVQGGPATSRHGEPSTGPSAPTAPSASGTRPTRCLQAPTRTSTSTCRPSASAAPAASRASPRPIARPLRD